MKKEFDCFKEDVDFWVKDLSQQLSRLNHLPAMVRDHNQNIDHNYELLQEMRAEMLKLKEEISALRMVQLLHLKADVKSRS